MSQVEVHMNSYSLIIVKINPFHFISARIRTPVDVNVLGRLLTDHYDCRVKAVDLAKIGNIDKLETTLEATTAGTDNLNIPPKSSVVSAVRTHGLMRIGSVYFHDGTRWYLKARESETVFEPLSFVVGASAIIPRFTNPTLALGC